MGSGGADRERWRIGVNTTDQNATLVLTESPATRRAWLADVWRHRAVLAMLSRKDFQTRYKRASLGVLWAVAVPLVQAVVMAVVFSKAFNLTTGYSYGAFVMSGIVAWSYFASTLTTSSTAIVDGSGLTDKVWFPRALLPIVPAFANLVGLVVSTLILVVLLPVFDTPIGPRLLLLLPASALLVLLSLAIGLVLSALHVYFRDVRFLVQAALLVWLYVTPVLFPQELLRRYSALLDLNPVTGVVTLFHEAVIGDTGAGVARPVVVTVVVTLGLLLAAMEIHRYHDRLFVDQL
jgi:ABC-2 type transport system permease protein